MPSLLNELRRRNVLKVAAAYALVAWILIEAGSVLLPTFGVPQWFFRVYVILVVAGWLVSMIIAWVFEITPDGIKRERDLDRDQLPPSTKSKMNLAIIALLVVALGVSVAFNVTGVRERAEMPAAGHARNSIAVLPFENRSTDPENRFFTDGIHDDLLARLSNVGSLRVISRTSVMEYRDTQKNLRQIGEELGVAAIVEGAVQQYGNKVRITVQLIDAANDEHLWANTYDRELTMVNVFDIQSEISSEIAAALSAALTPQDQQRLAAVPTTNMDAYTLYVAGMRNLHDRQIETLRAARKQFEDAIAADPDFAEAYAGLAQSVLLLMINHSAVEPDTAYEVAEGAAAQALELDPDLAQAHALVGLIEFHKWSQSRVGNGNRRAADAFRRALELNSNLADAHVWYGSLLEAEGHYDDSIEQLRQAMTIDPLSRITYLNLAGMLAGKGENDEAIRMLLRGQELFPDWPSLYDAMTVQLERLGRLDEAFAWGMKARELNADPLGGGVLLSIFQELGEFDLIDDFVRNFPTDHPIRPIGEAYIHFLNEEYDQTVEILDNELENSAWPFEMLYPVIVRAAVMKHDYLAARSYLLRGFPRLSGDQRAAIDRKSLGAVVMLAYLEQQLGNPAVADPMLDEALDFARAMPRMGMGGHGITDVQVLALQGRTDAALDALREAIDQGFVSLAPFELWSIDQDPMLDSLRNEPRYESMRLEMETKLQLLRESVDRARKTNDLQTLRDRVRST